jgi:phosphoribosylanthranilate isomerase
MTRREDVEAAAGAGADAVGFVVAPGSSRRVTPEQAAALGEGVGLERYLVTVGLDPDALLEAAETAGVDGVQPHGAHAADAAAAALSAGYRVLYPIPVGDPAAGPIDLSAVPEDAMPLLDTAVPGRHGGTGRTFDWAAVGGLDRAIVVAGGLHPGNVAEAVAVTGAWGADAASGVEERPGVKDPEAMRKFVEAVR